MLTIEKSLNQDHANTALLLDNELLSLPDTTLVTAAKNGAHAAFAELCSRHRVMVFHVVHRITRNKEDAEDALQDATLRAYRSLAMFDGRSSFSTWFTRIAINSALMILRKRRIRPEISLDSETTGQLQIPHNLPDPEHCFLELERQRTIKKAVRRLPPVLRSVVEIRYSQEVSVSEVAEMTGITVAATKSRLLRARKSLALTLCDNANHKSRAN